MEGCIVRFLFLIFIFFSCNLLENLKNNNNDSTGADSNGTNPDGTPNNTDSTGSNGTSPTDMHDRLPLRTYYTATTPCTAGDYSFLPTGFKDSTIECHSNGNLKKSTQYSFNNNIIIGT